jgi:AcrR family transcriptional regulator
MEDKRQRILKAAIEVFLRKGFDSATMDEIALKAGIAKGTIYLYFKDKADLYGSLLEEKIELLSQALSAIAASDDPPRVRLVSMIRRNLEFISGEYSGSEFFIHTQVGHNPEVMKLLRTRITPRLGRLLKVIAGVVQQGIKAREFRKADPFEVAVRVFGLVNVHLMRRALDPEPLNAAKEAASLADFVLRGISLRQGEPKR